MAWLQSRDQEPAYVDAPAPEVAPIVRDYGVDSEYGRLEAVLLGGPDCLDLVPCNSVTRESMRLGRKTDRSCAAEQHANLVSTLEEEGVTVSILPASSGLPDLCFARDSSLMTPWGLLGLAPGAPHRRDEVQQVLAYARASGILVLGKIDDGRIEGGDIVVVRPGLVTIGVSDDRTDEAGAEAVAAIFRSKGWEVITCQFDPHFLHLDTLLCMVDRGLALACTGVLDDTFLAILEGDGISLVDVAYKEVRRLGCNILALGDRRVLSAGSAPRIDLALAERGYRSLRVDLDQFVQCGGGVHCLTMPLRRTIAG